jgi:hypothetical protein
MDVETTMKINELAKDLISKGRASSSEEASKMAEDIMQKKILPDEPKSEVVETPEDKHRIMVDKLGYRLDDEMSTMKKQMFIMIDEIEKLTSEVEQLKNRPVSQPVTKQEASAEQKEVQQEIKQEEKDSHPRQGGFKPGDSGVDVNKIFYCGNK